MESNSPASAADLLLQRHGSSLPPAGGRAAAPAATATAASSGATAETAQSAAAAGDRRPVPAAGSEAELERMMHAARWGGGGRVRQQQQQQQQQQAAGGPTPAIPRMQQQPLSPVILPAREARQPDIVKHEAADVFDVLEFRLRNNDRDLQSLLSRSNDRLALSGQQQSPGSAAGDLAFPSETAAAWSPPPTLAGALVLPAAAPQPPPPEAPNPAAVASSAPQPSGLPVPANTAVAADANDTAAVADAPASLSPTPQATLHGGEAPDPPSAALPPGSRTATPGASVDAAQSGGSREGGGGSTTVGNIAAGAAATQVEPGTGRMLAPVARDVAPVPEATSGGEVVTPQRPIGGGESGRIGAKSAAGAPPARPQRVGIGGIGSSNNNGAPAAITAGGVDTGSAATAAGHGESVVKDNNMVGLLGTPPRLPRPVADGMIVEAAREAALWLAKDARTWHQGKKFMDECTAELPRERVLTKRNMTAEQWREAKVAAIKASITADPSLATLRHVNKSAFPMDGWTPLHAAAAKGNLDFVKVLLEAPGVSAWSVDLQGRTALALAASEGHLELCLLLKARMERESADTVVGVNAPVDLAGRTPLAWSVKAEKKRNREVEGHLYASGDPSVCPATPAAMRSGGGRTGTKGGGGVGGRAGRTGAGRGAAESIGDGLPCGYADAPGWRVVMEDAVCWHNPIPVIDPEAREAPPPDPTSMFGVFDGHGGCFTSKFCAKELVKCLQGTQGWKSGDRDLNVLCPAVMEAFVKCDEVLANELRMRVTEIQNPSDGKRFEARDGSGSTAVVALVTPAHVIVANAGDSRAILVMVKPEDASGKAGRTGEGGAGGRGFEGKKGAAETMAAALGSRLGGGGRESEEIERLATSGDGLNDSVRLEEQEEGEEGEDRRDVADFEGAGEIQALLEKMMLGEGKGDGDAGVVGGEGGRGRGGGAGGGPGVASKGRQVMVTPMSRDHTAMDERERERVTAAGGKAFEVHYTEEDGTPSTVTRTAYDDKVEGQSVVPTRGFGDLYYKQRRGEDGQLLPPQDQVVTACPEIMVHERGASGKEEFLLLACDGVWDVFGNEDAGEFLVSALGDVPLGEVTGEQLATACDALVNECLARGSTDNITALVVSLGTGPPPPPAAVGGRILFSDSDGQ